MTAGKTIATWLGGLVIVTVLILFLIMWSLGIGVFAEKAQANFQKKVSGAQITQNIYQAEFRQNAYETFFKECNDVVAMNAQIVQAEERVKTLKAQPDDLFGQKANNLAVAIADLVGLRQNQTRVAANYNAQSSEYTRNPFKDASLPYRLTPPYEVTCGA